MSLRKLFVSNQTYIDDYDKLWTASRYRDYIMHTNGYLHRVTLPHIDDNHQLFVERFAHINVVEGRYIA